MATSIGIDLGTTNTVVAIADTGGETATAKKAGAAVVDFAIVQLVAAGEVAALPALPSAVYLPASGELTDDALALPWSSSSSSSSSSSLPVGQLARQQGTKVPGRVITSAKSWLSVANADRTGAILPWAVDDTSLQRLSPVDVQTRLLRHVHDALVHGGHDVDGDDTDVTITIPASFDEVARGLTLQAAQAAGFVDARLIEEPQAAFYAFLERHAATLKKTLDGVRLVLVVDVGGGTTDLTLLSVEHKSKGPPKIERVAVGEHLMLGGDNMDVTLARRVEQKLTGGVGALDAVSFAQLVLSARLAKETLLADDAPADYGITLLSRGKKLLGGAKTSVESRDDVRALLLDGFLPFTGRDEVVERQRGALAELGLPYARDAALPRHISTFLRRHKDAAADVGARIVGDLPIPDATLLNGGVFRAPAIRARLAAIFERWADGAPIRFFDVDDADLDRAVARGAAYTGLVRRGRGVRIGAGSARSYFVGVGGDDGKQQALCIAPRGQHEGTTTEVDRVFRVVVGQPVGFPLYSSTFGNHQPGDVVDVADLEPLPAISTVLQPNREVPVRLQATLSEVGTLELALKMTDEALERFKLSFNTRLDGSVADDDVVKKAGEVPSTGVAHKRLDEGKDLVAGYFGSKSKDVDPKRVKDLRRDLEKLFGPREQWSVALARELGGVLLSGASRRRRSAEHERAWFQNVGFCLRPGVGAPFDDWRIEQLWPLWAEGVQYVAEKPTWASWFILWRRVAAGLDAARQLELWTYLKPWLLEQGTGKKGVGATPHGQDEMIRLAASLERLPSSEKVVLGDFILKKLGRGGLTSAWPLGRVGARQPLAGTTSDVVAVDDAARWTDKLLELDLKTSDGAAFALAQIARATGDRSRDLDVERREKIAARLDKAGSPPAWAQMIRDVVVLSDADEAAAWGEALPVGLRL
ncbi:MAG TPA: Hsp70 family protein [Myxococcota bacterium]